MLWFEPSGIGQRELQSARPQEKTLQGRYGMRVFARKELKQIVASVALKPSVTTIKVSDTLEHQPTCWPVPNACAQPHHPGSGSHGQLFRPY